MDNYRLWHPLNSISIGSDKLNIKSGEGIYVKDIDGKTYIDGLCGLWNVSLGYKNKRIINRIIDQLMETPYVNLCEFKNNTVEELANKIITILNQDIDKVYFTCTGSESNELAIKIMRKYHAIKGNVNRKKIGVLSSSYHGSYYGSLSASQFEASNKNGYGPFLDNFISFDLPFSRECKIDDISTKSVNEMIETLQNQFNSEKDTMAGFIIEPIIGSGGIIPLPYRYVKELCNLCKENDIILVCDEVATGFGRTGTMFAFEKYRINPDIVCMSKGINSGYLPMGAVAINKKISNLFEESSEVLFHLSTQNGNPVCCAATLATIEQLEENNKALIYNIESKGKLLKKQLNKVLNDHPNVYDIRGEGLMVAIDLVESRVLNEILSPKKLLAIVDKLKRNGLLVEFCYNHKVTSCISLFFAFTITNDEINKVVNIINKVFNKLL